MVHTATITHILTVQDYWIYDAFKELPGSFYVKQDYKWCNKSLRDRGIILWSYKLPDYRRILVMRINFIRLVEQQDRVTILREQDIPQVEQAFNELLQELLPGMPLFKDWKVNRIDYAVNVRTPYVQEYIKLLQKSDIPPYMKQTTDRHGNYCFKPGSFYLISKARNRLCHRTGSKTINFYDKYAEMQKQLEDNQPGITPEIVEQARDILRLEVQCFKPKTETIKTKYGLASKLVYLFLNAEYGFDILSSAIIQSCGTADFQRTRVAKEMIDSMDCTNKKKDALKLLISDISRSSLHKIKKLYVSSGVMKPSTFRNYIKLLEQHNINPVTISKNAKLKDRTTLQGLPSLWELFYEAYNNEMVFSEDEIDIFDIDHFISEEL